MLNNIKFLYESREMYQHVELFQCLFFLIMGNIPRQSNCKEMCLVIDLWYLFQILAFLPVLYD